jgi:hypothetical protein
MCQSARYWYKRITKHKRRNKIPCAPSQEMYEGEWSAVRSSLFPIWYIFGSELDGRLSRYKNRSKKILVYRKMKTVCKFLSQFPRGPKRRACCQPGETILGARFEAFATESSDWISELGTICTVTWFPFRWLSARLSVVSSLFRFMEGQKIKKFTSSFKTPRPNNRWITNN